jgi:hypothetical protein
MKSKTALQPHDRPGAIGDAHRSGRSRQPVDAPAEPENIRPTGINNGRRGHPGGNHPVTTLTTSLGRFVADLSPNRLPEEAIRIARMGSIDSVGTMIAARNEHAGDSAVLLERLGAFLSIDARDLTARL